MSMRDSLSDSVSMQKHDDSIQTMPPVFVINLERNTVRRNNIEIQLSQAGLDFEIFPATDGARLTQRDLASYDETYILRNIARALSPSEIGCYLSHQKLWQRIVDDNIPWALILEDDVFVQAGLKEILSEIDKLPFKWDLIRLAGLLPTPNVPLCGLTGDFKLVVPLLGASGTQATCISRRGARKLLAYSTMIRGTVDDDVIDNCWETGLKILAVQPYPIREDRQHPSSIQEERKELFQTYRNNKQKRSIKQKLTRRRYKLNRSLAKRSHYLAHFLFALKIKLGLWLHGKNQ